MGSTSYDEARDAADPRWAGASWYGPTTGEYWIVNPREYADPRKHGPGYSSRVRSGPTPVEPSSSEDEETPAFGSEPANSETATRATDWDQAPRPAGDESGPPTSGRSTEDGAPLGPGVRSQPRTAGGARRAAMPPRSALPPSAAVPPSATAVPPPSVPWGFDIDGLLRGGTTDPLRRLGLVLLAWAPIGIAAAGLIGDATGCATYSTTCDGTDPFLPWVAQLLILGIVLAVPPLARVFAAGAIAVLAGLIPATALVIAAGGARSSLAGSVLGGALAIAWLLGVAWATWRMLRARGGVEQT
jgi:hypothetical protein